MSPVTKKIEASLDLDLEDVQTIVLRPGGYPSARYSYLHIPDAEKGIPDAEKGRACLKELVSQVTDATLTPEGERPDLAINVGFTWKGLAALGVPWRSLASFPADFQQGMRARAEYLHDTGPSAPEHWDRVWQPDGPDVHAWVGVFSKKVGGFEEQVETELQKLRAILDGYGIEILGQDKVGMLRVNGKPSHLEHFGYRDGISGEHIAGSGEPNPDPAGGARTPEGSWRPLAPGEAVLGHPNEDGELGHLPVPMGLVRNGSYLVYRKLEQKVYTFRKWLREEGASFPGGPERLAAKLVGRWRNGAPLVHFPDAPPDDEGIDLLHRERMTGFGYTGDPHGARCPLGSHTRRANPRDSLGFDGTLVNRHRILRRGLPYGEWVPNGEETPEHDHDHGLVFMVINTSIDRQFEFVQREWVNYGNDFRQGNDPDPLIGHHAPPAEADDLGTKMVIPGDPPPDKGAGPDGNGRVPWICARLPEFVVTKGGDYFFVPSITALTLIAEGKVEDC